MQVLVKKLLRFSAVCCSVGAITTAHAGQEVFDKDAVLDNLKFSAEQYTTMLKLVDEDNEVHRGYGCEPGMSCVPSALDYGKIELSAPRRWTIGFFPGVLWMLLNEHQDYKVLGSDTEYQYMYDKAMAFSDLLEDQAKRTNTHDLGMMIDAPLFYALQNNDLSAEEKAEYKKVAKTGEVSLTALYGEKQGLIRSWIWEPQMYTTYVKDGESVTGPLRLSNPWQYPVIIDNMMNVEYLMKSDDPKIRAMGFSHAHQTAKNHFHYEETDIAKARPIAHHAFDYGEMKPGNWQGLGNVSAWARGQGWAIYGFVASAEHAKKRPQETENFVDYEAVAERVFATIKHFTANDKVPYWDYFATRSDAYEIASYYGDDTAKYSRILNLCIEDLPKQVLPYQGFGPIAVAESMYSDETLEILSDAKSVAGEAFVQNGYVHTCGTKPYYLDGRSIPKDTSAASLYAAALYRWAGFTDNAEKAKEYEAYADEIMLALTNEYRTDVKNGLSKKLGFVMDAATGHMPRGTEVDTPIVYGDYYFVEANVYKLKLIESREASK